MASLLHFDVSFMVWVLLGALGAYVASDLGLTPAQKGLMVAVPPLGGCMGNGAVFQVVPQRFPSTVGPMTGLGARGRGLVRVSHASAGGDLPAGR